MPEIKRIIVTVGGTINLGNYSNAKLEVAVEGELGLTETVKDAYAAVSEHAHKALALEIRSIVESEMDAEWLSSGTDAESIRRYVTRKSGFAQLDMIDREVALELVEETVAKYALPEVEYVPPVIVGFTVGDEVRTVADAGDWEDADEPDDLTDDNGDGFDYAGPEEYSAREDDDEDDFDDDNELGF